MYVILQKYVFKCFMDIPNIYIWLILLNLNTMSICLYLIIISTISTSKHKTHHKYIVLKKICKIETCWFSFHENKFGFQNVHNNCVHRTFLLNKKADRKFKRKIKYFVIYVCINICQTSFFVNMVECIFFLKSFQQI